MLTRSNSKRGEGALEKLNLEIRKMKESQKEAMDSPKKYGSLKSIELSTNYYQ